MSLLEGLTYRTVLLGDAGKHRIRDDLGSILDAARFTVLRPSMTLCTWVHRTSSRSTGYSVQSTGWSDSTVVGMKTTGTTVLVLE